MFDIILLISCGLGVGFVSSFFGIGGGAIIIPVLFSLFPNLPAQALLPVSLGMIFFNTIINLFLFKKQSLLPSKKTFIILFAGCLIGALSGSSILYLIDSLMIKKIFAITLIVVSIKTFLSKEKTSSDTLTEPPITLFLTGLAGAFLSAITGLGGGIIYVPIFMSVIKMPLKYISPFSNTAMLFASSLGLLPHLFKPLDLTSIELNEFYKMFYIGHVNFLFIFIMLIGASLSSRLGSNLNSKVSFNHKKIALGMLLLVFSLKTFVS